MGFETAYNEIRTKFNTDWAARTPIAWPNVQYTPPDNKSYWGTFTIVEAPEQDSGTQISLGATTNANRYAGVIIIQLFAPLNVGDKQILTYADAALNILGNWNGVTVRCRRGTIKNIGSDGQGWYQVNVRVPFIRDILL